MTSEKVTIEMPRSKAVQFLKMLKEVDQDRSAATNMQPMYWIGYLSFEEELGLYEEGDEL